MLSGMDDGDGPARPPAPREGAAPERSGYKRATGSARGKARRQELLERVTDDLAANGLVDFSLRRAARAAGTTHKVLLYYFDGVDDLLVQAVTRLRQRRIDKGLAVAAPSPEALRLSERVRAIWPVLIGDEGFVLDQAIGLSMYDPGRYAALGREASGQYLPALVAICPPQWTDRRRREVAEMILGTLRGFLVDRRTAGVSSAVDAGFEALARALDREEAADA
jgi:AcrR family transcriptional regulator